MKRFICGLFVLALLTVHASALSVQASSSILMDAESGRVLFGKGIHDRRLIASITKLMTALIAAEYCKDPDEEILIRQEWTGAEGSSIYLQPGEKVTFRELLYGALLNSGNDAAVSLACWVAGDEAAFAVLMNEKAVSLGMNNSSFANASGLNHESHYSTAYDMALLTRACLKNPLVAEACATRSITIGTRTFVNHNKLLYLYKDCIGMKTGYTELAGRTLISAAKRNGQTLICVTLNDGDDWNDHKKLLDYGFEVYPQQTLAEQGEFFACRPVRDSLVPRVEVAAAKRFCYPLKAGDHPELRLELVETLIAPVPVGTQAGKAVWSLNGEVIGEIDLICAKKVESNLVCKPRMR